jgi:hypothetical protein
MSNARDRQRFLAKALEPGRTRGDDPRIVNDFDGDCPVQARVARAIDLAIPPAPANARISKAPSRVRGESVIGPPAAAV